MSKQPTIKQTTDKLEQLMQWFDSDDFEIEEAISKYEEAKKLADDIKAQLDKVENTITTLKSETED